MNVSSAFGPTPGWPGAANGPQGQAPQMSDAPTIFPLPQVASQQSQANSSGVAPNASFGNAPNSSNSGTSDGPKFPELGFAGPFFRRVLDWISPPRAPSPRQPTSSGLRRTNGHPLPVKPNA